LKLEELHAVLRYSDRHQRKLLAIFAILAMFGFVVSDSLPKLLNPSYGGRDQPVVKLFRQDSLSQRAQ